VLELKVETDLGEYKVKKEALEALLAGTGLKNDPAITETLAQLGYNVKQPPAEVSLETVRAILELVANHFFAELPRPEAMRKLGRLTFEGYRKTPIGRILLAAVDVWGATRLLRNSPQVYRAVFRYGERDVRELGPNHWEQLHRDEPGHIEFLAGVTEATIEAAGSQNVILEIQQLEAIEGRLDYRFEIKWD